MLRTLQSPVCLYCAKNKQTNPEKHWRAAAILQAKKRSGDLSGPQYGTQHSSCQAAGLSQAPLQRARAFGCQQRRLFAAVGDGADIALPHPLQQPRHGADSQSPEQRPGLLETTAERDGLMEIRARVPKG